MMKLKNINILQIRVFSEFGILYRIHFRLIKPIFIEFFQVIAMTAHSVL